MNISIASPNPQMLPEMVALVQRLDAALLRNPGFLEKMASLPGSFLNWSINGYDFNENYRKAGVHLIKVFLCQAVRVMVPMAMDQYREIMTETKACYPIVLRSSIEIQVRTRNGLEISSGFSLGAESSEDEFKSDLIDWMTSNGEGLQKFHDKHREKAKR
jgi:hypothetical protein